MSKKIGIGVHNNFTFTLVNAKTGKVTEQRKAYNVVLDSYYLHLAGSYSPKGYYYANLNNIQLGTGLPQDEEGNPTNKITDLTHDTLYKHLIALSASIESTEILDNRINKRVYTAKVAEQEGVGEITEVGLGCNVSKQGDKLFTHALITDSEGNPSPIKKTDADILYITATLYTRIDFEGMNMYRVLPANRALTEGESDFIEFDMNQDKAYDSRYIPGSWVNFSFGEGIVSPEIYPEGCTIPPVPGTGYPVYPADAYYLGSYFDSIDSYKFRLTSTSWLSTANNLKNTYLIKCLNINRWGYFSFPNHSIYPPKDMTFTAKGDGNTTGFDFPIPELMTGEDNVTVTVNGEVKEYGKDYVFNGRNHNLSQGWESTDTRYVIDNGLRFKQSPSGRQIYSYSFFYPYNYLAAVGSGNYATVSYYQLANGPAVYDFKQKIKVDTMRSLNYRSGNLDASFSVYYSDTGKDDDWTEFGTIKTSSTADVIHQVETPVEARFWKAVQNDKNPYGADDYTVSHMCVFGHQTHQLEFTNPPDEGASITVKCKCEYPMKNDKWRIDPITIDFTISRAEAPSIEELI